MSRFGVLLKSLREKRDLSLQDVADRAALSKAHVWEIETGSANPTIKTICCLAVALNESPDELAAVAISDCMDNLRVGTASHSFVVRQIPSTQEA